MYSSQVMRVGSYHSMLTPGRIIREVDPVSLGPQPAQPFHDDGAL